MFAVSPLSFSAINPSGHVPAIDDNGVILFESHAIMRYLVNQYGLSNHWYPRGQQQTHMQPQMQQQAQLSFG